MIDRQQKIKIFIKEVKRCLLLSKEERDYWSNNAETLSDAVLDDLTNAVSEKNKKMDNYISIALMNDKDGKILGELKQTVKNTKKKIISSKEDEDVDSAEESLAESLKNI